jgi:hypothetical protein
MTEWKFPLMGATQRVHGFVTLLPDLSGVTRAETTLEITDELQKPRAYF